MSHSIRFASIRLLIALLLGLCLVLGAHATSGVQGPMVIDHDAVPVRCRPDKR